MSLCEALRVPFSFATTTPDITPRATDLGEVMRCGEGGGVIEKTINYVRGNRKPVQFNILVGGPLGSN